MKEGDRFIRYSSTGRSTKGTVRRVWAKSSYDILNGVRIKREFLEDSDGRVFEKNECFLIDSEFSLKLWLKLRKLINLGPRKS
jgi:hypothetical protein